MPDASTFELTLPIGELIIRGSLTYLVILALMRMGGQREAGGLGITDVVLVVLVSEAASPGLHGSAESLGDSLVVVLSILFWSAAVDALGYWWPAAGRLLKSGPQMLVKDGRVNRKVMRRELMSDDELESLLRLQGVEEISTVKRACIEPNGMVSIVRADGGETEAPDPPPAL